MMMMMIRETVGVVLRSVPSGPPKLMAVLSVFEGVKANTPPLA